MKLMEGIAMHTARFAPALAAAALFAGCASTPTVTPQLQEARAAVQGASADAVVTKYAPLELKKASDSLRRADELSAQRKAPADIDSAAYVAATQARTAQALARAQADEEALKSANAERERARADANDAAARRARAEASSAQAQAVYAQAEAAALQRELADLRAKPTDRGTLVTLGDVLFEFGRADIRPAAQNSIAKLANYLNQHPERHVLIEGFTDSIGSASANMALSQRRCQAVADALRSRGIDPSRVDTRGYGEQYPLASNANSSDRALNRRVEVYISNDDQPVRARG